MIMVYISIANVVLLQDVVQQLHIIAVICWRANVIKAGPAEVVLEVRDNNAVNVRNPVAHVFMAYMAMV